MQQIRLRPPEVREPLPQRGEPVGHDLMRAFLVPPLIGPYGWNDFALARDMAALRAILVDPQHSDSDLALALRSCITEADLQPNATVRRVIEGELLTFPHRQIILHIAIMMALSFEAFVNEIDTRREAKEVLNQICAPIRALII